MWDCFGDSDEETENEKFSFAKAVGLKRTLSMSLIDTYTFSNNESAPSLLPKKLRTRQNVTDYIPLRSNPSTATSAKPTNSRHITSISRGAQLILNSDDTRGTDIIWSAEEVHCLFGCLKCIQM
jgi:hypothetical protein